MLSYIFITIVCRLLALTFNDSLLQSSLTFSDVS
jgi:hypothetical protein